MSEFFGNNGYNVRVVNVTQETLPEISSISPTTYPSGNRFLLTVNGTDFAVDSDVRVDGVSVSTSFVSAIELEATVTGAAIPASGATDITVVNPGVGTSGPETLTVTGDASFASVTSLLHFDGTDGSTTFTDVLGTTWSVTGANAVIDDAQSKWGFTSGFFGSNSRITTSTASGFGFGTGDYTIEFWMRPQSVSGVFRGITDFRAATSTVAPNINLTDDNIQFREAENNRITSSGLGLVINTWYHVAVARSGNDTKMFVNGTQVGSTYSTNNDLQSTCPVALGCFGAGVGVDDSFKFLGWIDEFRVTKGVARYTSNFTAPTLPFASSV